MNEQQVKDWFAFTEGTPEQTQQCIKVRTACAAFANVWVHVMPDGPEQTYCLRKLKDTLQAMIGSIVKPLPRS